MFFFRRRRLIVTDLLHVVQKSAIFLPSEVSFRDAVGRKFDCEYHFLFKTSASHERFAKLFFFSYFQLFRFFCICLLKLFTSASMEQKHFFVGSSCITCVVFFDSEKHFESSSSLLAYSWVQNDRGPVY